MTVSFQESSHSIAEGSSDRVCGQLSSEAAIAVTVAISMSDGTAQQDIDFSISSLSLIFQPGSVQSCVSISAVSDSFLEGDESFTLILQSFNNSSVLVSPTAGGTRVTILDQDSMYNNHPV